MSEKFFFKKDRGGYFKALFSSLPAGGEVPSVHYDL